jgi:hypothetical protein
MLQAIGLMMAGYIFTRLLELIAKSPAGYRSNGWHDLVIVFALLGMIGTVLGTLFLVLSGGKSPL